MVGDLISHYRVIQSLGEGGMARVFLAEDTRSGNRVALKISRSTVKGADEALKVEFEALRTLAREEFPSAIELFPDGAQLCLAMEFIAGETLETQIGRLSNDLPAAVIVLKKLFAAMAHAGACGIVHTDLKPANIFVDGERVRIIDFGLATGATTLTAEDIKEIKGTLDYLSPEQAEGRPLDVRSDIFSMGVIAYQMVTGRKPFDASYDMATIYSILYEDPTAPSKLNADVSPALDKVIMVMLAKTPEDRYHDFSTALKALEEIDHAPEVSAAEKKVVVTVAPFSFHSGDEDSRLFAEGLREDLITGMSKIEALSVTPAAASGRLDAAEVTSERVRTDFGADFLLTGSVRRAGAQIRVTVSLVDTKTNALSWSEKFDSALTNLFDIQDMISREITTAITSQFSGLGGTAGGGAPSPLAANRGTKSVEAYEFYLKGRNYLTRNTKEDMDFARLMLEKAIERDPNYPLAYAGMADLYGSLYMNYIDRSDSAWEKGLELAKRAISLDPSQPVGYRAQGRLMHLKGRYDEAIVTLMRAATLDANFGQTYRTLAWACLGKGDLDQSLAWTRKALTLDSHDEETILLQGIIYFDIDNVAQAINAFSRCLELKPDYGRAHYYLAKSYQRSGKNDLAIKSFDWALKFGGDPNTAWDYGWMMVCDGQTARGIQLLESACREESIEFAVRFYLGYAQQLTGAINDARVNFERARTLSTKLLDDGDNSGYPDAVLALCGAALREGDLGASSCESCTRKVDRNGDLAAMLARYWSLRGDTTRAIQWIEFALQHRQGPSRAEVLNDPFFATCRTQIELAIAAA